MSCYSGTQKTLKLKRNDTLPKVKVSVVDSITGLPVDLTGGSADFIMVTDDENKTVIVNNSATITDAPNGKIEYSWIGLDTSTSGSYLAEFEITLPTGKLTLPNDDSLKILIVDDFA